MNEPFEPFEPFEPLISNDVLQHITVFISCAQTFANWALVSRKTANASRLFMAQKKVEFGYKVVNRNSAGLTSIYVALPNGTKHGEFTQWYNNGIIRKRGTYENGYRHGIWEWLYYSGKLRLRGGYVHGMKHGPWIECDTNGSPTNTIIYRMGIDI